MEYIVESTKLSKNFGVTRALNELDLKVEREKVLGILGPNGSGKTTFMKIIAGLTKKTSGEILIDGEEPGVYTKSIVSFLPDREFLYSWMTIADAIEFFDDFFEDFDRDKMTELLEFMSLNENMDTKSLSKGMMEKLNLSLVLSRRAELYILDEPIGGVDIVTRDKILEAIIGHLHEGSTMVITTHLVKDMEGLFDDVAFIKDGRIIKEGNADDLREEHGMQIEDLYRELFN